MSGLVRNHPLTSLNTFGISASARYWAEFDSIDELRDLITELNRIGVGWFVLGGGSNIILTDRFEGAILHPTANRIERTEDHFVSDDGKHACLVRAEAGVVWDDFVAWTVSEGLGGAENLSYIPGHVGASPIQNIGAYGSEVKDVIEWVEYFDTHDMEVKKIAGSECRFGYRDSIFKHKLKGRAIVTAVVFRLIPVSDGTYTYNIGYGDLRERVMGMGGPNLQNIREAVTAIRKEKLPDPEVTGNAGSFFKNPVIPAETFKRLEARHPGVPSYPAPDGKIKVPAAWLIDQAGWKGYRGETVGVHPKQALVVINLGGATAQQILDLGKEIIEDVNRKFGIEIEMEVNVL